MKPLVTSFLVSALVTTLAISAYERFVRQPRTPRLAVVDITRIYEAAETSARRAVLSDAAGATDPNVPPARSPELEASRRNAENFGPSLQKALTDISTECGCAIVAMAAVIGIDSTIPDFTSEVAMRMDIDLVRKAAP